MLSRVADSLYWMSRYLERAENTARLLDVTMSLMLDPGGANAEQRWQRMTAALGRPVGIEWNGSLEAMAHKLVFDHLDPSSVTYCINGARENARQVREEISTEQWQRLNRLFHHIHSPSAQSQYATSAGDMLASVVDGIHLFQGVGDSTMIHGQGWQFIRLGRSLERAYATATLLEVFQPELFQAHERESSGYQYLELVGLLRCCTAFGRRSPDELFAGIGKLHAMLGYTTISEILGGDAAAFLHNIREQCLRIHELVYRNYVHYSIQSALAV